MQSLIRAAADGDVTLIKMLIAEGVDVNATNPAGQTALMLAALMGKAEIVKLLIAAGANVGLKDNHGLTSLEWARRRGFTEIAALLEPLYQALVSAGGKEGPASDQRSAAKSEGWGPAAIAMFKAAQADREAKEAAAKNVSASKEVIPESLPASAREPATRAAIDEPTSNYRAEKKQVFAETPRERVDEAVSVNVQQFTSTNLMPDEPRVPSTAPTVETAVIPQASVSETFTQSQTEPESRKEPRRPDGEHRPTPTTQTFSPLTTMRSVSFDTQQMSTPATMESTVPLTSNLETGTSALPPAPSISETTTEPTTSPFEAPDEFAAAELGGEPDTASLEYIPAPDQEITTEETSEPDTSPLEPPADLIAPILTPDPDTSPLEPIVTVEQAVKVDAKEQPITLPLEPENYPTRPLPPKKSKGVPTPEPKPVPAKEPKAGAVTLRLTQSTSAPVRLEGFTAPPVQVPPQPIEGSGYQRYAQPHTTSIFARPALWVMLFLTAIVSSAATYLITTYFRSAEKTSSTAGPSESQGTTTTKPIENSAPVTAGAIAGAEASLPNADYPTNAKIVGVNGSVTVLVRVNGAGGVVIAARALNGDRQLRAAAERAARKARFSPEKLPHDTKVVSGTITYRFGATTTESNPPKENDNSPVIGGGLVGAELSVPNAAYPEDAKSRGVGGAVMVLVQVNRSGEVVSARALNGDQALQDAAETAAAAAKFSPEKLPNEGNIISGTIIYKFNTNQQATTALPSNKITPSASPVATLTPATNSDVDSPVVGGDLAGKELNVPKAEYPSEARRRRISGAVKILVRVNKQGKVVSWRTLSGDPLLKPAAIQAARRATFSSEKLGDGPTVLGTITYTFKP